VPTEEMAESSTPITSYYDSLTGEQIAEDRAWGDFALMQFQTAESIPLVESMSVGPKVSATEMKA
jgi:hypothetical protein